MDGNDPAAAACMSHDATMATEPAAWLEYQLDAWQRSVLFLDTLRERADRMLEHEQAGLPPVLSFEYETILDAHTFTQPTNYTLLRITTADDQCAADCVKEDHRPVIIVDPRAGHGPGIGGFKRESEVGIALHEGHPVYFVSFTPRPCPGQTLDDVLGTLRRFIEAVIARHPDSPPPALYGNCQAGWAIILLCADCSGLTGPAILNGSPLSYWSGAEDVNPMRLSGGLLGGAWPVHLLSDLGDGQFDGAWLALNFENLNPGHALLEKYLHLYTNIDDERQRFLDFERWWNGFYFLSKEEITAIVENLFIGNRLERGRMRVCPGCHIDLRRIRNPILIFASSGDNITPPHQALNWIPAIYPDSQSLKDADQRIVYLLNPHVGHLGIFVSSQVARLEHRAILESIDTLGELEPGLYEMKITHSSGDPDCHETQYAVTFEERRVEDVQYPSQTETFDRVREISELNTSIYEATLGPWIRLVSTPWSAEYFKWIHPMRTSRYLFSERFNPSAGFIRMMAGNIREHRQTTSPDNPFSDVEKQIAGMAGEFLDPYRRQRDTLYELTFSWLYQ